MKDMNKQEEITAYSHLTLKELHTCLEVAKKEIKDATEKQTKIEQKICHVMAKHKIGDRVLCNGEPRIIVG